VEAETKVLALVIGPLPPPPPRHAMHPKAAVIGLVRHDRLLFCLHMKNAVSLLFQKGRIKKAQR
jgi:hypothetical protein